MRQQTSKDPKSKAPNPKRRRKNTCSEEPEGVSVRFGEQLHLGSFESALGRALEIGFRILGFGVQGFRV